MEGIATGLLACDFPCVGDCYTTYFPNPAPKLKLKPYAMRESDICMIMLNEVHGSDILLRKLHASYF